MNRLNFLLLSLLALAGVANAQRAAVSLGSRLKNRFGRRNSDDDSAIIQGEPMFSGSWVHRRLFEPSAVTLVLMIAGYIYMRKRTGKHALTHPNEEEGELPTMTKNGAVACEDASMKFGEGQKESLNQRLLTHLLTCDSKLIFFKYIVVDDFVVEHDHVVARAGMDHADLAMEGLKLTMKGKKETKEILDGSIRVRAQPGRMLAIMGPSGKQWRHCLIRTASQSSSS